VCVGVGYLAVLIAQLFFCPASIRNVFLNFVAALIRNHNVGFGGESCIRLPFPKSPTHMYDQLLYRSLGPLLDPRRLSRNPQNYGDPGHFNRSGTDLVSEWLDSALNPYLSALASTASYNIK
jgi:hypothetical protein